MNCSDLFFLRFLAFRRCGILASVIVMYFVDGTYPNRSIKIGTFLCTTGAIIAGWEKMETDILGFVLVWMNNFSQAIQNVYIAKLNKEKKLSAFDINFFFACCGLVLTFVYNFIVTSDY